MNIKPNDLFVSIVGFFAVILPGAILAFLLLPELQRWFAPTLISLQNSNERHLAFLVAAYLLGSFVALVAALMDRYYAKLRGIAHPDNNDNLYTVANAIKKYYVGDHDHEIINTFKWSRALLQMHSGSATSELDRLEAEQKFFRSLFVVLCYGFVREWQPTLRWQDATLGALLALLLWHVWYPHNKTSGTFDQWRGVLFVCIALTAAFLTWQFTNQPLLLVVFVLLTLSFWRYFDQRWKCTQLAYTYLVVLEKKPVGK